ncbi:high affinity sulfate transporter 1 [Haloactinopolyspora alba]|uniref:High affinity sulfate transporter 1 n=1 Tax=Haloactinopolyspora alba TaxID=648780 RepID=A0A2P8E004_9ACTN|nr:SulP family inorganic anion transporter [Haloactinopolyspora alba]PSL02808.1 high affinity sulfate transporter 1 [Haloactinopolyspora alba]
MPGWLFASFQGYQRAWLRRDVLAGLTVWAVLIPESLAYASIAGVSPVVGLYAAIPALLLYPLFGSSRHLVVGPMSATAALSASVVGGIVTSSSDDFTAYTAGLALAVGVVAALAGLLRLGFLATFISEPVLKGFIVGMALVIIVGQLPKLFGVEGGDGNFFQKLWAVVSALGDTNGWSLLVGGSCLALVLLLKRVAPLVPAALAGVVLGIVLVAFLDLQNRGVDVVGEIEAGMPSVGVPEVAAGDVSLLLSGAAGVMLVGFTEGLGAAKSYAQKYGYRMDANRELIGLGAANVGSGLAAGMVVNGSLSKTAVNGGAGARSQLSGYVVAALTVLTLLFLTPLFETLPDAALGAVVIAALIELVDVRSLRQLYNIHSPELVAIYGRAARADFICAVAALLGVLVYDTLPGLIIGVALSVLLLLYRASRPHVAVLGRVPAIDGQWTDVGRHPENTTVSHVVVARVESGLFFANAEVVGDRLRELASADGVEALILDAGSVPVVDVSAARMLGETADEMRRRGVRFVVVGDVGQVRDVLRRTGAADDRRPVFPTIEAAVTAVSGDGRPADPDSTATEEER